MKTRIAKIFDLDRDYAKIKLAAEILKNGGLVALPTETVYGIAANALDSDAVQGIFEAKGRPTDNPLIVHIESIDDVFPLVADFPPAAKKLAESFWPGPLTMVLPKTDKIPSVVSAKLDTVAIRMPSHPVIRAVIRESGLPLAAPSANLSGRPSPTSARHCIEDLNGKVALILDGGDCEVGIESTVISLATEPPRLLRPGMITLEQICEVLGEVRTDPAVTSKMDGGAHASSPGMKYKHYAPKAKLTLVHGDFKSFVEFASSKTGAFALVFDGEDKKLAIPCITYGAKKNPAGQARRLFSSLRALDEAGAQSVFVRAPEASGESLGVYNRLLRAAAFNEVFL